MEWKNGSFIPHRPADSPKVTVKVTIMHASHKKFGKTWNNRFPSTNDVEAIADSGCQTCTAGVDFLHQIKCPPSYLVSTRHRIVGITNSPLGIIGSLFVQLDLESGTTRQMIHISKNCRGLYLSRTALKDLNIVSSSFPQPLSTSNATGPPMEDSCQCLRRADTPNRPEQLPYDPTAENVPALKE